jgi:uncharacterized membrane protein YdbT with pleckstrin-like domain
VTVWEDKERPPHGAEAKPAGEENALWSEGPSGGAVGLSVPLAVPTHLLDGGEVVILAIKPSAWFVLLVSLRWLVLGVIVAIVAGAEFVPVAYQWYLLQAAIWLTAARLGWATLEWVSRLYVLTDRRVMRIQGVFEADLFECALIRIQSTTATFSPGERILRVGTIRFETAGESGGASWRVVAKPLEVHRKLREAIRRAQNRGHNGV